MRTEFVIRTWTVQRTLARSLKYVVSVQVLKCKFVHGTEI